MRSSLSLSIIRSLTTWVRKSGPGHSAHATCTLRRRLIRSRSPSLFQISPSEPHLPKHERLYTALSSSAPEVLHWPTYLYPYAAECADSPQCVPSLQLFFPIRSNLEHFMCWRYRCSFSASPFNAAASRIAAACPHFLVCGVRTVSSMRNQSQSGARATTSRMASACVEERKGTTRSTSTSKCSLRRSVVCERGVVEKRARLLIRGSAHGVLTPN